MAKFKTLDLHLTKLDVLRIGPGIYRNTIEVTDWDDGVVLTFTADLEFPVIAVSNFKLRVQIEDLEESPPES